MAEKINFQIIKNTDHEFLYDLLLQRNPDANISHKKMPTYEEHVNFVKSSPYSKWYVIEVDGERAGSIYLTKQNEIGIHFFKKYEESERYQHVIKRLMLECPEEKFFININPRNELYLSFAKELGFSLIQHTYERDERYKI